MVQIPTLQMSSKVKIAGRASAPLWNGNNQGEFVIEVNVSFDPAAVVGYPTGSVKLQWNRPQFSVGQMDSLLIDHVTYVPQKTGRIAYIIGRCKSTGGKGCQFWIMIADENEFSVSSTDIICFVILDCQGNTVASGAGKVARGDIIVQI